MHTFPRPAEATVSVAREPVEGECAACGAQELRSYPVLSEGGWFRVVKCQRCLVSKSREPWNLAGSITFLSEQV
ncbi:MAG: hypothetical protein JOZ07_03450 [Solirubrobacterales bacterium]|nr:hypothetical protein [Solirubrobacterales bacterium]